MSFSLINQIIHGDCLEKLKDIDNESIDCIVTDPPYGYSFMNKDWDKAVVSVETWKECLRVMKAGAFAFIMSSPRQDVLCKMILNLIDAGFETNFTSIYWTYASGFPKAANVSKLVDKRNGRNQDTYKPFSDYLKQKRLEKKLSMNEIDRILGTNTAYSWWEGRLSGVQLPSKFYYDKLKTILDLDNRFDELIDREEAEREIIGKSQYAGRRPNDRSEFNLMDKFTGGKYDYNVTKSATEQAKKLDGSYAGFQPKPALEVILTVMKPLSEKSFVDQALKNGKGITWLDDCRIPFQNDSWNHRPKHSEKKTYGEYEPTETYSNDKGRFPANLIVSDDALNDGKNHKVGNINQTKGNRKNTYGIYNEGPTYAKEGDSGSYSRYFDLDAWFLAIPKASASERNKGLENEPTRKSVNDGRKINCDVPQQRGMTFKQNFHPTVKPLKLMSYLITMGSRENDLILDPFCGSGTTCIAATM